MSTAAPKKKRVLFIINQFFRGGAETALVNLLRTMDSARFDVDLLIFDMIDLPGSLSLIPEIPDWVHVINVAENEKKTAFVKKAVFKLERKLTGTQPFRRGAIRYLQNQYYDAAISYGEWFSSALCARYAAARRKYVWIHADMDKAAFLHPDILRFEAQFDGFLFASRHSMEGAVKKYPQLASRSAVLPNRVDSEKIIAMSEEALARLSAGGRSAAARDGRKRARGEKPSAAGRGDAAALFRGAAVSLGEHRLACQRPARGKAPACGAGCGA